MKKVLFMHSGSANHGCEAIVRTTAKLLEGPVDLQLWSWNVAEDHKYGTSSLAEKVFATEELGRFSLPYFEAQYKRLVGRQSDAFRKVFLKHLFRNNIAISIGGDNYCYPWSAADAVAFDQEIRKYCAHTVLWGCSVEESAITPEARKDLAQFDLITARESITYECLRNINPNTVLVSDPAFLLDRTDLPLPEGFREGNTVGINVSPLIMKYGTDGNLILGNYDTLIRYILEKTDMQICLIPHVVWEGTDDREPLKLFYEKYRHTGRICMVSDANCCELKGYIARCRFFVGARTHATIAAYSSCVPTLVTGYSVKARGIARDLFGAEENYVLPVQSLKTENELADGFCWLLENEDRIRSHLNGIMPEYKNRAWAARDAFDRMVQGLDVAQEAHMPVPAADCTGCGSCAAACPRNCIKMLPDAEGFRQPVIDQTRCIDCHLCEQACPLLTKPVRNESPDALAAKHKDIGIRADSSSGGVFTALAEAVIAEGGAVCAVKYDTDFSVVHDIARSSEELAQFRGAKYAQSRAEHCYPRIRELLRQGTKVLFVGTPCQVAGLSAWLGKPNPNLILVDMICHGVPSPKVWQHYLTERTALDAPGSSLQSINLRSKESGWSRYSYSVDVRYANGSRYCVPQGQDWYMRGFTENLYLRPSCENCRFKGLQRCSDLTLGDFWGVWEQYPEMDDNRGTSLLWLNSGKGRSLWKAVAEQFDSLEVSAEASVRNNRSAVSGSEAHPKRAEFFAAMDSQDLIPLIQASLEPKNRKRPLLERIVGRIRK